MNTDKVLDEFKEWLREKGLYNITTIEEVLEYFKQFEEEKLKK